MMAQKAMEAEQTQAKLNKISISIANKDKNIESLTSINGNIPFINNSNLQQDILG